MNRRTQNIAVAVALFSVALISLVVVTQVGKSDESEALASAVGEQIVDAGQSTTSALNNLALDPANPSLTTQTTLPSTTLRSTTLQPTTQLSTTSTTEPTTSTSTSLATTASPTTTAESTTTQSASSETTATSVDVTGSTMSTSVTQSTVADPTSTQAPTTQAPTTQAPTTAPPSGGLNAVEVEIARLTNELRANPNGPLKRQKPPPAVTSENPHCGDVLVDRQTGVYESLSRLQVNAEVSLKVSRPWSEQMTRNLRHQASAGGVAMRAAGISWSSVGENIAFHNYSDKAINHFVGWRESDGHFCNMMNPRFTHIGVGEHTKSNGDSMATQNFYIP